MAGSHPRSRRLAAGGGAAALFPVLYFAVRLAFFGERAVIHPENVRQYWVLVGVLAVSSIAALAAAHRRGGRRALAWHSLVAAMGLVLALLFSVSEPGQVDQPDRTPEPREQPDRGASVCHSGGGSDECVGG
ncbi:DUF6234 family protein [Nocardioides piscis]|uniref:NnrS family protein n=1 Tax=Nocardioides piscis TaxID=2714938 RepID=A0A6G7YIS3_9ACTN|nr:DUF6234 family protein [Nocardioides piscis]QIK76643.1 NnrS family protein [Nocardioides piscis]